MGDYRQVFKKKNALLVVIHVLNAGQVCKNAQIALESGADGIFLIDHQGKDDNLIRMIEAVEFSKPDLWKGANFLGCSIKRAFKLLPDSCGGLWVDNSHVSDIYYDRYKDDLGIIDGLRLMKYQNVIYFGGFAFKYQEQPINLASASVLASRHVDVITTSGDATGKPPSIEKISIIRGAIGDFPLAIASGMTPENVSGYCDMADCFLVSTGISKDFYNLDPKKVEDFVKAIS